MIEITDKKQCCGCGTCAVACPTQAIVLRTDSEGFRYPVVDVSICISCGKCDRICSFNTVTMQQHELSESLLLVDNDDYKRNEASSGGAFGLLAEEVIAQGGIVFGAAFNKDWKVCHVGVETLADLSRLKGSKYVESDLGNCYSQVLQMLSVGRIVLFSGTPCQVAGLSKLLDKTNPLLLLVEVACHGVPSSQIWSQVLDEYCEKENIIREDITNITFRDKTKGWKNYRFTLTHRHGSYSTREFPYVLGFAYDLYLRPSCHACRIKDCGSYADITIADAWGVDHITTNERFLDDRGISFVIVHTAKGYKAINSIVAASIQSVEIGAMLQYNRSIMTSASYTDERRRFFDLLSQGHSVEHCVTMSHRISLIKRVEKWFAPILVRLGIKGFTVKWKRK